MTTKPLKGINVVECSAVFAGPICSRLLADGGAEVIKIESPDGGDQTRGPRGDSRVFAHFNAGKRSIAVNLASESGRDIVRQLIARADVFIENFRPGVMQKFGLDYAALKDAHPGLVYCSISGFGQTGPYAQHGAYAPIAHASSGYDVAHMRAQADPDAPPQRSPIMIADMLTGSYAFGAIQTALIGRAQTGLGDFIDVSMQESMMMLIPGQIQGAQTPDAPRAGGFRPVRVRDGYVMVCIVSERNFVALCQALDRMDLVEDERFERSVRFANMDALVAIMEEWGAAFTADEAEARLNATGVPVSRYNAAEDLFTHPQVEERGTFLPVSDARGDFLIQRAPFLMLNNDNHSGTHTPSLGEHTDEVVTDVLGLDEDALARLRANGAIA